MHLYSNYYQKKLKIFFTDYKNECKKHKIRRQKNQKSDFYENKKILNIDDFDINEILFSKTKSYDKKEKKKKAFEYFIGYHDNDDMDHYIYGI